MKKFMDLDTDEKIIEFLNDHDKDFPKEKEFFFKDAKPIEAQIAPNALLVKYSNGKKKKFYFADGFDGGKALICQIE